MHGTKQQWLSIRVFGYVLVTLLIIAPVPSVPGATAQGPGYACTEAGLDAALAAGSTAAAPATFACIGTNPTITVSAQKTVSKDITLDGGGILVISGGGTVGVFTVNTDVAFTVQHLSIAQGYAIAGSGIVNNGGTLTVTDCTLSGNTSTANDSNILGGGAIFNISRLTVTNSRFTGNTSMGYGGAIFNLTGDVTLTGSTLSANRAVYGGGGVYTTSFLSQNGTLAVTDSLFSGNFSGSDAGIGGGAAGIHVYHTAATITRTVFSRNALVTPVSTSPDAGGIINDGGRLTVMQSTFTGGFAVEAGGIFNTSGGTAIISDTTFSANGAVDGSVIVNGGVARGGPVTGTVTLTASTLTNNGNGDSADGSIVNRGGTLTVLNSTIAGDNHSHGIQSGAIWNDANSALTLRNSTLSGNTGGGATGGVINSPNNTTARLQNNLIVNNIGATGGANADVAGLTLDSTNLTGAFTFADPDPKTPVNHGGPTPTLALPPSSPAIDAVPAAGGQCPATDQRGTARPQGNGCDIGAYEYVPVRPTLTGTYTAGTGGGLALTLTGTGFQRGSLVSVSGAVLPANVVTNVADNGTTLRVTLPMHAAGVVTLTVTNPGNLTSAAMGTLTYQTPQVQPTPTHRVVATVVAKPAALEPTHTPGPVMGVGMPTPLPQPVRH